MSVSKDDPRLVLFALGEMSEEEATAFEAEIDGDPVVLAEIEATREIAGLLREGLAEKGDKAAPVDKKAVEQEAQNAEKTEQKKAEGKVVPLRRRFFRYAALPAVAAAMLGVMATVHEVRSYKQNEAQLAQNEKQKLEAEAEIARLEAEAKAQEEKTEGLLAQLGQAKDELTRESLRKQLDEEYARREVARKAGGGGAKPSAGGGYFRGPMRVVEEDIPPPANTESYSNIDENPFTDVATDPRSTFSIDVDTASYALVRRHLEGGRRPPKGAVRIEELVNYFPYDDPSPVGDSPFAVRAEVAAAPWAPSHRLVRVALKGKVVDRAERPGTNLVFLLDVSGSMDEPNKLPLLKRSLGMLVAQLDARDRVSIVVYAGASGLVLPPTSGANKRTILNALDRLQAGGSTNGGEGIELAYAQAALSFIPGGVNRVILATDGDFNIGVTDRSSLVDIIKKKAKTGVFLSVLGFGMGNYKDDSLESLSQYGNGNYAYVDSPNEARKVLVEQVMGTLVTIAKDVKIQVEFNPKVVQSFRLIGYENRVLAHRDFNDDKKDAGDIGAGHSVTALYEIVPVGAKNENTGTDPLKYQAPGAATDAAKSGEMMTVALRYKAPDGNTSQRIEAPVFDSGKTFSEASTELRFAASVAAFGMILRESPHKGDATFQNVVTIAQGALGEDPGGYRQAFVELARKASTVPEKALDQGADPWRKGGCQPGDPLCSEL